MKAYIQSFKGNPWNEECLSAMRGFEKLNIECIMFSSTDELESLCKEDIVVGGMLITEHCLKKFGIKTDNYNYPEELKLYLGREIKIEKIGDLSCKKYPFFIKPVEEKIAKGIVVNSVDDLAEYNKLNPDTIVFCSEPMNIKAEYRCFIRYGELIGVKLYNGCGDYKPDMNIITDAVNIYKKSPSAYSLDFAVTANNETLLIEMNDGLAIGSYGLDDELYAKFLYARWAQLMDISDPFDFRLFADKEAIL